MIKKKQRINQMFRLFNLKDQLILNSLAINRESVQNQLKTDCKEIIRGNQFLFFNVIKNIFNQKKV